MSPKQTSKLLTELVTTSSSPQNHDRKVNQISSKQGQGQGQDKGHGQGNQQAHTKDKDKIKDRTSRQGQGQDRGQGQRHKHKGKDKATRKVRTPIVGDKKILLTDKRVVDFPSAPPPHHLKMSHYRLILILGLINLQIRKFWT